MEKVELPALLPNEHLLSVLARWFDTTGRNEFLRMSRRVTSNNHRLNPSAIWRPVYRHLLHHFLDTKGIANVLSEHTLVPYYRSFIKKENRQLLSEKNLSESSDFKLLPTLQSNIKTLHCWRWCAECTSEDDEEYGVTYWHTYHQIPTMLRCYKHNVPLLAKCQSCGFEYKHFQRHWLPPKDRECKECHTAIEPVQTLDLPIINWLDAVSISLQQSRQAIELQTLITLMQSKLGYEAFPKDLPFPLQKKVAAMQVNFENWLEDELITHYFSREREAIFKPSHKVLNIVTTVYRDSQVPPISLLLMFKSLGLEHELTKLLLE
jgi:hypothetical protein